MLDRRISLEKLSKRLRISKEDALDFMSKAGLTQSSNSKGFIGWPADKVKHFMANMSSPEKSLLQGFRVTLEEETEKARDEFLRRSPSSFVSKDQVAKILDIPRDMVTSFLGKNNVIYFLAGEERLYLKVDILHMKTNPTRFQAIDIKKLKVTDTSTRHITNSRLAKLFDVPEELVGVLKKKVHISGVHPLVQARVDEVMNRKEFASKRIQVLNLDHGRSDAAARKDGQERFVSRYNLHTLVDLSHEEIAVAIKNGLLPTDHHNRFVREQISLMDVSKLKSALWKVQSAGRGDNVISILHDKKSLTAYQLPLDAGVASKVQVTLPCRKVIPKKTSFYVGPTNSGKTYSALENLFKEYELNPTGKFVYAGPLRMLAFEVYEKMVERFGADQVGFITGEEQINPEAPLVAATVEMAPTEGSSLVLDEAHWITDSARGHHWTNLLMGGDFETFHVLTAVEAQETLQSLLVDSLEIELNSFTRKTKIAYAGDLEISSIPPKTAVIAFSEKGVYAVAQEIEAQGIKVGVLYGALPLSARKHQIQKFVDGDYDVIVTTDVIGHGINLPVDNVVFAETSKFDGVESRELKLWEAAQIAGRAGRFKLSDQGRVYSLVGLEWAEVNRSIVKDAAAAAMGTISTGMVADRAIIAPSFSDFNTIEPDELSHAMACWQSKADAVIGERKLAPSSLKEVSDRLRVVAATLSLPVSFEDRGSVNLTPVGNLSAITGEKIITSVETEWKIQARDLWQIVAGPFDVKLDTLKVLAAWLQESKMTNGLERLFALQVENAESFYETIKQLEVAARLVSELKMANIIFQDETYVLDEELEFCEKNICEEIISILDKGFNDNTVGLCQKCGKNCSPWFDFCAPCFFEDKDQIRA